MQSDVELPQSSRHFRAAAIATTVLVLVLAFIDIKLAENSQGSNFSGADVLRSVLENIIGGAVAAFVLATLYRWIVRYLDPGDRVLELKATQITERMQNNARNSTRYLFIGNTATFVCASVLPILCDRARSTGRSISASIFIIDPREVDVVNAYVRNKDRIRIANSRPSDSEIASWVRPIEDRQPETPDEATAKLYACIYLSALAAKCAGVNITLNLKNFFSPFRADLTDEEVILTQESPAESAVAFSSRGHFYGWYDKEAEALEYQCETISLSGDEEVRSVQLAHPSSSETEIGTSLDSLLLVALGRFKFSLTPNVRRLTVQRISRPQHSYGPQ